MTKKSNFTNIEAIFDDEKKYKFLNDLANGNFEKFKAWLKQLLNDNNSSPLFLKGQYRDLGGPFTHYIFHFYCKDERNHDFQHNIEKAIVNLLKEYNPDKDNNDYFSYLLQITGDLGDHGITWSKYELVDVGNKLGDRLISEEGDGENLMRKLIRTIWGFGLYGNPKKIDEFMQNVKSKYGKDYPALETVADYYFFDREESSIISEEYTNKSIIGDWIFRFIKQEEKNPGSMDYIYFLNKLCGRISPKEKDNLVKNSLEILTNSLIGYVESNMDNLSIKELAKFDEVMMDYYQYLGREATFKSERGKKVYFVDNPKPVERRILK